ncbi:hypothetical protein JB92DRAFT_3128527 [Gautieria morchelliformis]|nr:hypothetical protein JB92DRAFT_3128527 [Gautieria morchelliformis]
MVHPAISKCAETPRLASDAATASPNRNEHIPSRSLTSLQISLRELLDMMTPLEFSHILRFRIKSLLLHWPPPSPPHNPQRDSLPYSPPGNTITIASVIGLVSFFLPRAAAHTPAHDLGQLSIAAIHSQLCQLEILLTFLSVSELMQVFRNRLRDQTGPVRLPNAVRGVLDVMRGEMAGSDTRTYETHQFRPSMNVPAVRGGTKSASDSVSTDSPSLPEASICSPLATGKTMHDCPERPPKRFKADIEINSDIDRNGQRLPLHPVSDTSASAACPSISQESIHARASSDGTHAFTTPSLQNATECDSSSSTLTASQCGQLIGELPGWRESSSVVNKRKAGSTSNMSSQAQNGCVESAPNVPLSTTSLRNAAVPSVDNSDTDNISVEGKRPLLLGASGHPQAVRSSSSAVAANQVSMPLSRITAKLPRNLPRNPLSKPTLVSRHVTF